MTPIDMCRTRLKTRIWESWPDVLVWACVLMLASGAAHSAPWVPANGRIAVIPAAEVQRALEVARSVFIDTPEIKIVQTGTISPFFSRTTYFYAIAATNEIKHSIRITTYMQSFCSVGAAGWRCYPPTPAARVNKDGMDYEFPNYDALDPETLVAIVDYMYDGECYKSQKIAKRDPNRVYGNAWPRNQIRSIKVQSKQYVVEDIYRITRISDTRQQESSCRFELVEEGWFRHAPH